MKINRFFMLFAAMVMTAAASCNKEEFEGSQDVPGDVESAVVFKATSEAPVTKTVIDGDGNVTWKAGDQVAFYWQVGGQFHEGETDYPYTSNILTEDTDEAEFKIDNASETFINAFINNQKPAEGGRNLYAVYPASSVSTYYTDADHKALDITIPVEQEGTFESASIALAKWATATPTELKFRNLCALLKVTVTDETVRAIVVKSDSDIAGKMQLTFKDDAAGDYPVVGKVLEGAKSIKVKVDAAGSYYVAVRPGDIENLYIELQNEAGVAVGGQTAGRTLTAERANVYSLSVAAPTDKLFVKTAAAGDGSGSSWDNAMTLDALATVMTATDAESKKVYMAAGTYLRQSAIQVKTTGFEIYGGFPATASGYDLTGRDVKANATIIDGGWGDEDTANDVYARIFLLQKGTWVFDGVTFQNIMANNKANGSALQVISTDGVTIRNCSFINCQNANTSYNGGALRIDAGNIVNMESCTFEQNQAQNGGAIYVAGNLNAVGCDFVKNIATVSGGAIYEDGNAFVKMDKCEFSQNNANGSENVNGGGAVYMEKDSNAKLYLNRSSFVKNTDKYNAHHIYTRSENNWVGLNNCVIRGPYGVKTTAGSLLQLKGLSVIVNTTMYGRTTEWGTISLGSKTNDGCRVINDIIINSSSNRLSFYTTAYSVSVYNTIYTDSKIKDNGEGTYDFIDCLSGADALINFPYEDNLWKANNEMGTSFRFEDGRSFNAYAWEGTTEVGEVKYSTLADIKTLISGTANIGTDFLGWLESDELKVNGVEALAVDIRGVARDTEEMWPGSYQEAVEVSEPETEAGAENFNVK